MIYLDYQATTLLAPEAFAAMEPWLKTHFGNPHSSHVMGRAAAATVEAARAQVAALMPENGSVIFTSGATEALNLAIKGTMAAGRTMVATEHAAVLDTVNATSSSHPIYTASVTPDGLVDETSFETGVGLGIMMLVNNEIGVIQPVAQYAQKMHDAGGLMLCDAVQAFGRMPIPEGPDMIAVSAHKIHGPKGIGALWIREGVDLEPVMHGGRQEQGIRSGTLSPALCAGFGAAAKVAADRMAEDHAHVEALWNRAIQLFSRWTTNGSSAQRYKGNLNIRLDGLDVARLMSDVRDVMFSAGSACASGSGRPSHVLAGLGLTDAQAKSSIRLGFGRYTTIDEIEQAASRINLAVAAQLSE
ncbi:MAG: cysteine desulfurase family protein [Sphingorhabdus sp.]